MKLYVVNLIAVCVSGATLLALFLGRRNFWALGWQTRWKVVSTSVVLAIVFNLALFVTNIWAGR